MKLVEAYVVAECGKGKRASKSMLRLEKLLNRYGALTLQKQSESFLEDCRILHESLMKFSDLVGYPMATHVAPTLERLFEYGQMEEAPEGMNDALRHHQRRLEKNHNMNFWKHVMWFSPKWIVQFAPPCNCPPILVDLANNLFVTSSSHCNTIFSISEDEWNDYASCTDYGWDPLQHVNENDWWMSVDATCSPKFFLGRSITYGHLH